MCEWRPKAGKVSRSHSQSQPQSVAATVSRSHSHWAQEQGINGRRRGLRPWWCYFPPPFGLFSEEHNRNTDLGSTYDCWMILDVISCRSLCLLSILDI